MGDSWSEMTLGCLGRGRRRLRRWAFAAAGDEEGRRFFNPGVEAGVGGFVAVVRTSGSGGGVGGR